MNRYCERLCEILKCVIHGRHDLSSAPAYAMKVSDAPDKELHYCRACGSPVWVSIPRDPRPPQDWTNTGLVGV